ncbi:MAG: glycosyltransferase [Bacteroidales bacterium]|nr:glycosyltransferase [Bacteroidales bacterium]
MTNSSEKKKLHILFLPRWYPNRYDPMFGLFVQRHAEAVALRNQVSVVYVNEANSTQEKVFEINQTEEQGVFNTTIYYRKSVLKPVFLSKIINGYRFYKANFKGIGLIKEKSGEFQLIHVHILTRLGLIALWFKLAKSIPFIITEHWSRYLPLTNGFKGYCRKTLTKIVVKNASFVTTVTNNLAEAMKRHGLVNQAYVVLPNVVDVNLFTIQTHEVNRSIKIVHISCFEDRSKNITGLLHSFRKLSIDRHDFECVLIGEGMDFEEIRKSAIDLESAGIVRFTGLLQNKELVDELASSDFLVLFSNYESMPVVIPEAFACGLPVLATRVGGIPEIVNNGNGLLVDSKNENQLTDALITMLDSYKNYDPEKLRESVKSTNSYEAVSEFLDGLYQKSVRRSR